MEVHVPSASTSGGMRGQLTRSEAVLRAGTQTRHVARATTAKRMLQNFFNL